VAVNPALQAKLRHDFRFELPAAPDEWDSEAFDRWLADVEIAASVRGWRVERGARVGLFAFYKLVIYDDLAKGDAVLAQNPLVLALTGDGTKDGLIFPSPSAAELDESIDPADLLEVADAD